MTRFPSATLNLRESTFRLSARQPAPATPPQALGVVLCSATVDLQQAEGVIIPRTRWCTMTGIECYHAIRQASRRLGLGSEFSIGTFDVLDLQKLTVEQLCDLDYDETVAKAAVDALGKGDVVPMGKSMGLMLLVDTDQQSVFA